jgi:HPt (histidine-containing phosphotransfer) domain-containing protein
MTHANDHAVLNETLLAQYREMDAKMSKDHLLPRLYHVFEKNFPDYLGKLTQAVQAHDPDQISHYIHKMLGMAHNIGAYRLSQILLHWEQLSLDNKMEIDTTVLDQLAIEFKKAETALEQYIEGGKH